MKGLILSPLMGVLAQAPFDVGYQEVAGIDGW